MPVSEIAVLPLSQPITKDNPTLPESIIQKLRQAKEVLQTASSYPFRIFQQIEDPSTVYILGLWDSVAAHTTFLASPENQGLLDLFKDDISFVGDRPLTMWHLEGDFFALDPLSELKLVFTAPAVSYTRHFVPVEKKEEFDSKFQEVRGILEAYTKPFKAVGGWRIEKEEVDGKDREEWALFSGYCSPDHHASFAKTEPFEKYKEIVSFIEGFDVKHLKVIEGLS